MVCNDSKLNVKLSRTAAARPIELQPATSDEPLFRRFRASRISVKHGRQRHYASTGDIVITARRMLILLRRGPNGKGAEQFTVVSVDREELSVPSTSTDRHDRIKSLELTTTDYGMSVSVPSLHEPFAQLLEMLAPESAQRLGPEAAAVRSEARQIEEHQKQEAERKAKEEKAQAAAAKFLDRPETALPKKNFVSLSAGGIFDHRRRWYYRVAAPPGQCTEAFLRAFSGGGGLVMRAKWALEPTADGAVATYRGRKGLIAVPTVLSQTASAEQEGAIGSEVKFEITGEEDGHSICAMWLALRSTRIGFTNDGRFFRPYMRAVETELRRIDPSIEVIKE
jgi:hypothetical protein